MNNEQNLIENLKAKNNSALEFFYKENLSAFLRFSQQYNLEEQEAKDIYQDAVIAVYENAQKGKLDTLEAKLSTYLFSVGKHMIFRKLKTKNQLYSDGFPDETAHFSELDLEEGNDKELLKLQEAFAKLGNQCKEVLRLFYYEEKKLDEIMQILEYSTKDVLKNQKSRCIKRLKYLMNNFNK